VPNDCSDLPYQPPPHGWVVDVEDCYYGPGDEEWKDKAHVVDAQIKRILQRKTKYSQIHIFLFQWTISF